MWIVAVVAMALLAVAGCESIDRGMCDDYLDCVAAATPDALVGAQAAYGEDGTCWESEEAATPCRAACESMLEELGEQYPGEAICGGDGGDDDDDDSSGDDDDTVSDDDDSAGDDDDSASDDDDSAGDDDDSAGDDDDSAGDDDDSAADDDDDDTYPAYTGGMSIDSVTGSCTVTVAETNPNQYPPPSGWFDFYTEIDGWADWCWIELWDDLSAYCEGYDVYGNPCNNANIQRPGWEMNLTGHNWDPVDGYLDTWELQLDYEMVWPPDPNKSLFICENAGDPSIGAGTFWTYVCCCDLYDPSACNCQEFSAW